MDYIVDPKIFYWVNTLDNIKVALIVLLVLFGVILTVNIFFMIINYVEGRPFKNRKDDDGNPTDPDWRNFLTTLKISKRIAPIFIAIALMLIFIPSKETVIEMMIAKIATAENINWSIDALKSVVDYIVEAIGSLK